MPARAVDAEVLRRVIARHAGVDPGAVAIDGLRRLSGGASRETWAFDAILPDGTRDALVLRRDPGALAGQTERATEYAVLAAAHAAEVPVPRPRFVLGSDAGRDGGLGPGFVMERVEGETIARRILRDDAYAEARAALTGQCAAALARIHAVGTAELTDLPVLGAVEQLDQFQALLDAFGEPHPAFELALRRLRNDAPATPTEPVLVHGDFRNGNFVVGPEGLLAVLDWELAHLGDPAEDLGWLCVRSWRFGRDDRPVGGFGDVDTLLGAYRDAGAPAVDPEAVRYWMALGTLKWGVICIAQAFTHLNGFVRSVELAAIGRRVAETEWDLLDALEGRW